MDWQAWSSSTNCEVFRGQRPWDWDVIIWKSWYLVGQNYHLYFSPFVDQSSPDSVCIYRHNYSLQCRFPIDDILFQSGDICNKVAKSSSWKQFFGSKNLYERTSKIRCWNFYAPTGTHHVEKFSTINRPQWYKLEYTKFLTNFRILIIKKSGGQTEEVCISKCWSSATNCEIFRGQHPLAPEI